MNPHANVESLEARRLLTAFHSPLPVVNLTWDDSTATALADRWIVRLGGYEGTSGSQLKKARRLLGDASEAVEVRQYLISDGLFSVQLHGAGNAQQQYALLSTLPGFISAEPDWLMATDAVPNDPFFGQMSGLQNASDTDIDAPEAWNITTGSMTQVVGIVDSGVDYTHRDLTQNIFLNEGEIPTGIRSVLVDTDGDGLITFRDLNNAANIGPGKITDLNGNGRIDGGDLINNASGWEDGVDNDTNGLPDDLIGWNFLSGNNDPMDVFSHGTHVAGTVGAVGNNTTDVVGVNWNVRILPLKTGGINGSDNTISIAAAIASINYSNVMRSRGLALRALNASWGGGGFSNELFNVISDANAGGTLFVAAAGNGGADGIGDNNDITPHYPSSYEVPNVIAVLNTTSSGNRNFGSNYGLLSVDLGAPGTDILSTVPGNGLASFTGTSMASPHVAGAAALLFTRLPNLSIADAKVALFQTVDPVGSLSTITSTGGRLNAFRAITAFEIAAPSSPDLDPASDTGSSNSDNITRDTTPTFFGVTQPNYTVQLFLNNSPIGIAPADANGNWSLTLPALANGTYNISSTVTDGNFVSLRSGPISVRIDTLAPVPSNGNFPHLLSPQRVSVTFNEPMENGFTVNDATITNLTTGQVIPPAAMVFDYDLPTNRVDIRFPGLTGSIVPDGNYTVSILSTDPAGNAMAAPYNFSFFILYGDSNRNRVVDLADFAQMSANFGQTPRSFAQGDYNFDNIVNIGDFALLAANYNRTLPAPGDLPRGSQTPGATFSQQPLEQSATWADLIAQEHLEQT